MIMVDDSSAIDLRSIILDNENQNNVKLGDIIYLKIYLKEDCKGLISGEGFGTNKLECLLIKKGCVSNLAYKQAELNIFRCLFRIIDSNYQNDKYANRRKSEKNYKINDQLEQINVVYGQEIQLMHLYSKSYLSLDSLVIAKENGCRELKLETKITQNTCFMFQSNTKNSGEPLLYGDILLLKSGIPHLMSWGLGVEKIEPFSEVHASQLPDTIRICSYGENLDNTNVITNGDIIIFRNRYFGGYLSVIRKECCTNFITTREINRSGSPIFQKYLELENFRDKKNLEQMFKFTLENEIRQNAMFLIIKINNEGKNKIPDQQKPQKTYIIQHVQTGAFLIIENEKLSLTYDTLTEKSEFSIKNLQKVDQLIQEGEFYRFFNLNQAIIQCENNKEVKILQQNSKSQLDLQLFQFKRGPYEEATSATKIQAFYLGIIEFYVFLQNWGLDEQLNYSYQVAFKQQKQLYDEIKQFEKIIVNINLFLNQQEPSIKEINQYSLCTNDILDLLVMVQQQIDQMTFQENMSQSILVDKSAQRIAKSKFAPIDSLNKSQQFNVIQEIYNLIYLTILDNSQCCDYIIIKDHIIDFLMSQAFIYKDTVERIITKIVSKARPVYHVASRWVSKIQPITKQNLEEQSFIIKIVSLFVSSSHHSNLQCQNLCRKKLLRSNPFKLIKCQILDDNYPIAVVNDNDENFYEGNREFCDSHQEKYSQSQKNHIYFEFFSKYDLERYFSLYEQYLINVLYLYAKICEKRNIKNIYFVRDQVGISLQFLERLRKIEHTLLFQKLVIELFTSLYYDISPLTKISKFENTCYLKQDLLDFDIQAESGFFFYENVYSKTLQKSEKFQEFQMSSIQTLDNNIEFINLKQYSKHVITKQRYHISFIQIFTSEDYPKLLFQDSNQFQNYSSIAKIQLTFFLSLIRLIKHTIELGYNPLSQNQCIMTILPHIFIGLIIQLNNNFNSFEFKNNLHYSKNLELLRTSFQEQVENLWEEYQFIKSKSWITEFLIWSTSICDDQELIENIFIESVEIYKSYFYLECNLKILYYLTQKSCSQQMLFPNHNVLLFRCLFGTSKLSRLIQEILHYLGLSLRKELHDLKEIKEVEILDDEIELKYFAIINGHQQSEDFLGPQEIKLHIKKTLRFIKKKQENKRFENSFVIMHKYIKQINSLYDGLKNLDQSYTHSLQNMMRNAGIHLIFINFLIKPQKVIENEEVENFYRNLLKFWENFLKDNQMNFQLIYPYLEKLLRIVLIPQIDSCSLTYHSLCISKIQLNNAESESIKLIQNICNGLDFKNNLIHIRAGKQYLKLLRALTKTNNKPHFNIQINQRQILNILLSDFRVLIDPINYFGEIENIQKEKQKQLDVLKYQQLRLHSTALNLVADCCQHYFLGVQEMQRILLFESLINILHHCPYVVKSSYLRCLFELYINQTKQNNQINDMINFTQIKDIFNFIIIPDLELMRSIQKRTTVTSSIKVSNNDYWKYILQTVQFSISIIDEFRMMDKQKQPNIKQEIIQVQQYLQQLIKENQRQLIRNNADYINQVIRLVDEYIENDFNFNQQSRIILYCARKEIYFKDLINYVESFQNRDNFEKLKEICNQNNKSYFQKDELKKTKRSYTKIDIVTLTDEWYDFKLKFNTDLAQDLNTSIRKRMKEEQGFQELKEQFAEKKIEIILNKLNEEGLTFEIEYALSEDTQMFIFIKSSLALKFKRVLIQCKQVFHSNPKYLIKLLETLFEIKKPKQDQLDQSHTSNEIDEYVQYQNIVSESEIDLIALEMLNSQEMIFQLDAITLIQHLLDFGNEFVQQRLFNVLKNRKKRISFVQFFKNFFNINIIEQLEILRLQKNSTYEQLCIKVLQVLQGLCENVHLEFQKFLLIQNEQDSITNNFNFIGETTNLLLNFVIDSQVDDNKKWKIYQQGLLCLIEFSTGLQVNKQEITFNKKLFIAFNKLFKLKIIDDVLVKKKNHSEGETDSHQLLQTFQIYIKLLISLLEGNMKENKDIFKFLLEVIDIQFLLLLTKKIYHLRINPKKYNIYVDNNCMNPCKKNKCNQSFCFQGFKTIEDSLLIEACLNIFIIGFKLVTVSTDDRYDVFKFSTGNNEQKFQDNEEQNKQENVLECENTFSLSYRPDISEYQYEELNTEEYQENSFGDVDEVKENQEQSTQIQRKDDFFVFFRELVGRIEVVDQQGKIERILFQKPFVCKYITPNIKYHLIYETNRETDEDRIASFVENIDFYHSQMIHFQKMSTFPIMHFGQKHWRKLKDLSYTLCILIVLFFIIWPEETGSVDQSNGNSEHQVIYIINNIITIVQLVLNLIIIIFCAVERYPIAMHFSRGVTNSKMIQNLRQESGYKIPEYLMKYYAIIGYLENNFDQKQAQKNPLRKIIILLIVDFDNFYNVIVFGITIIAFFNTYVYAILLLDIIKRSEVLQYIIKAVTQNARNLILFGILGVIGLVQFGFIARISFSDQFKKEQKYASDSLGYSIAHVINLGLRSGGGIGDALDDYPNPFEDSDKYWSRFFYDLTFFVIFNMIFIQMIFGIIVDKFGELRDERSDLLKDIEGKCFICSLDRNVIDSNTKNGWHYHIFLEHNVYHMLYYLIYIKMKPITECNQLEKYIKDQIENKQSDFFPMQSTLELQEVENMAK